MCDDGYPDVYNKRLVKPRAIHKCVECGDRVEVGDRMWRVESLLEGQWNRHYTCLDCEAIREHIFKIDPVADVCHGELIECLHYSFLGSDRLPNVWWLQSRLGGKFKLAKIPAQRHTLRQKRNHTFAEYIVKQVTHTCLRSKIKK